MDAPESHYDYKKFAILYVDDEERSLKNFARAFGDQFRILTAPSAQEGLRLFEENPNDVALLITDQRMPGGKGVELLEKVRRARPRTIRILTSAYSDLEAAIDAVNSGAIYKYVTKPWDLPQLESTLKRAMEFFLVQRERDQILRAKLSELRKVVITDRIVSLGVLASGLGHYVRNSLVAVRTFMELMPKMLEKENAKMEQFQDKEFWNDFYAHVQTQLRHIVDLLQNLGEASEKPSFEIREEIDIASLFLESYSRLRPELDRHGLTVRHDFIPNLPKIQVDRAKFQRFFDLLLKECLVSLPSGSQILFKARELKSVDGPGEIRIELEDNGPGMSPQALRSIFDPFFLRQENPQEFGIHLMGCYFIIYHHGGRIDVQEREGGGVKFTFWVPTHPKPRAENVDLLSELLRTDAVLDELWASP